MIAASSCIESVYNLKPKVKTQLKHVETQLVKSTEEEPCVSHFVSHFDDF